MTRRLIGAVTAGILILTTTFLAQERRPMSPRGTASAQVLGTWTKADRSFAVGGGRYDGGKWIDITYGRPLKRQREIFGSGPDYGKATLIGAPIWRAGADVTTRLKTEVPLVIAGKTIPVGEYSLFVELKERHWTLIVSDMAGAGEIRSQQQGCTLGRLQLHARQRRPACRHDRRDVAARA